MAGNKKASIVLVLKTLEEYSDADHYLTQKQIIDHIKEDHDVTLERKSVAASIVLLQDAGYDIVKGNQKGFALLSRTFDESEVKFLIDAVFSSRAIPAKQAKNLLLEITSTLSVNQRKTYEYLLKSTEITRTDNKQVFINIDIINEAIKKNKWVGYKYITYDENGKEIFTYNNYVYHASPCYLVNNYGRYYMLGYRRGKNEGVAPYRVDKMKDVYIMDDRVRIKPSTLEEFSNAGNITNYLNEHIYLFGGRSVNCEIKIDNPYYVSAIKDWFGERAKIIKEGDHLLAKVKCNEHAFFYWAMQYCDVVEITKPASVRDRLRAAGEKIVCKY